VADFMQEHAAYLSTDASLRVWPRSEWIDPNRLVEGIGDDFAEPMLDLPVLEDLLDV